MCMDVIVETFSTPTYQLVVRWKVFRVGYLARSGLSLPYQYSCNGDWLKTRETCPRDEWLLSEEAMIGEDSNMKYASGFHVLNTEKDAEKYRRVIDSLEYGGKTIKMKVMVMGLKAIGQVSTAYPYNEKHPDYADCEVYDWMYIPPVKTKLKDVSAQEVEDTIRYLFSEVGDSIKLEVDK